jgi:hypothetical protein
MVSAAEYVLAYQELTGSDSTDAVTFLVEFLTSYGMADVTLETLCQLIDEEGIAPDFGQHLRENGLVAHPPVNGEDEADLPDTD